MNKEVGITLRGVTQDNITPNIDENMIKELLNNRELYLDFMHGFNPNIETVANLKRERDALKYLLQEYKDLEEQGRLIKLPCKVGDVFYAPLPNYEISVWRVEDISIGASYFDFLLVYAGDDEEYIGERFLLPINDIGKIVFLTREEAEAKLKEMGK